MTWINFAPSWRVSDAMPELYPEYDYQDSPERNEMNNLMRGYELSGSEESPLNENYPTANQIRWLRDCNATGYDPVLDVQVLRDKVMLLEQQRDEARAQVAALTALADKWETEHSGTGLKFVYRNDVDCANELRAALSQSAAVERESER